MSNLPEHPVVYFDGVCNLCNFAVQFIIKRDSRSCFRFASLQSPGGQEVLKRFQLPAQHFDTFLLLENNALYCESTAALRVCRQLDGWWKLLYILIIVPAFVRNFFYRLISKNRYRWFGRRDQCMMPDDDIKNRFV